MLEAKKARVKRLGQATVLLLLAVLLALPGAEGLSTHKPQNGKPDPGTASGSSAIPEEFKQKIGSALFIVQQVMKGTPQYSGHKSSPGRYLLLDTAKSQLTEAAAKVNAPQPAVGKIPTASQTISNAMQDLSDAASSLPASSLIKGSDWFRKLTDPNTGAAQTLSQAEGTPDPVLQDLTYASSCMADASMSPQPQPTGETTPFASEAVKPEALSPALTQAAQDWKTAYKQLANSPVTSGCPGATPNNAASQSAIAAKYLASASDKIAPFLAVTPGNVNAKIAKVNGEVASIRTNLDSYQKMLRAYTQTHDSIPPTPQEHPNQPTATQLALKQLGKLLPIFFSLAALAALIWIFVLLPKPNSSDSPDDKAVQEAFGQALRYARAANNQYSSLEGLYATARNQHAQLKVENDRLRIELARLQTDLQPQTSPAPAAEAAEAAQFLSAGGQAYPPINPTSPPPTYPPKNPPLTRYDPPPPDPVMDYNRTLEMDLSEGAEFFLARYSVEFLSCPNLEDYTNPNIELHLERSSNGNFMAVKTPAGTLVFPSLTNNPVSARRALLGIFHYPETGADSLRLVKPAYVVTASEGGYVLDVAGEFVRAR